MKNLSKMLTLVALVCLFAACAKKTQETVQYSPPSKSRNQDDQRQNRRSGPPQFSQLLAEMDANGDGLLSQSEVKGPLGQNFATIDANKDGFISEAELKNAPKPQRGGRGRN